MTPAINGPIKWGIIGSGDVAEHKAGPPLYQTPGSELIAVMRRDVDKAADFACRHGARRWYSDVPSLLADPDINAVYVASPHGLHVEHVRLAAQAGKAILCEKPMGISTAESEAIVTVCREHNVPLAVAYYRRLWPVVQKIKALLDDGAIGTVVQVRVQLSDPFTPDEARPWLTRKAMAGGGALANAGSHWVDLIRYLIGDVAELSAYTSSISGYEVEDTAVMILRTVGGVLITFSTSWTGSSVNDFDITGTQGRILASPLAAGHIRLERPGHTIELFDMAHSGPAHREFIADLIPRLQSGAAMSVPGEEAVAVWRIMDAAYQSAIDKQPKFLNASL